jgi:hypothetical protein
MPKNKDCIKKHETCVHRDWYGKCTIYGCLLGYENTTTPIERFYFGLNFKQRSILRTELGVETSKQDQQ